MKKPSKTFDVAVVGAGPAGSTAALHLAQQGLKVLLVKKSERPGDHAVCAGGLAWFLKERHHIPDALVDRVFSDVLVETPRGSRLHRAGSPLFFTVIRSALDAFLASRAVESGADLVCGMRAVGYDPGSGALQCKIRRKRSLVEFHSPVTIFADGPLTLAWPACGIGNPAHGPYMAAILREVPVSDADRSHYAIRLDDPRAPLGYLWSFPKKGAVNIGIGGPLRYNSETLRPALESWEAEVLGPTPQAPAATRAGLLPMGPARWLHAERSLVCGDAGGFVNPMTGGGLFAGMESARLAAETVLECHRAGRFDKGFLGRYPRKLHASGFWAGLKAFQLAVSSVHALYEKTGVSAMGRLFSACTRLTLAGMRLSAGGERR